jgi:hypothetical protein
MGEDDRENGDIIQDFRKNSAFFVGDGLLLRYEWSDG